MNTLDYIVDKFQIDLNQKSPITISNCNRKIMAEILRDLEFNTGVEVGVAQGFHSELLCQINPNLHLYAVDSWEKYSGYRDYLAERLVHFEREARERLSHYNCTIIKDYSVSAAGHFPDNSLDFVYIDGAHDFLNVATDICKWIEKVKSGGIIYGHDYKRSTNPKISQHVVDVVNAYTYSHKIKPWFVLGERGPADGMYKEGIRQWMWIK